MLVAPTEFRSGCRARLFGCGRCRIQLAVSLPDPSGTEMALHCDADMVWAIVGTCQVKFLSGPAGRQGQDALGGLEIGQLRDDRCAVGVEACKPLADLRLFRADLSNILGVVGMVAFSGFRSIAMINLAGV